MGRVLHACDSELRRDVAIKVLADRYAYDETVRARFRREALAAARLSRHPNIVTIFDVAEHDGRPMIVMEYLEGGSLEARLRGREGCPPAQVFTWLEQAARALDAAHAAGVVHRDVKPGNLLLGADDQVHVGDFGIASAAGLGSVTETGTIMGTAGYLSPEQARGERATAASDRYSLAVVAFELLTGRRPFESASTTAEAAQHATAPVPSIHAVNPDLPATLDPVFERALAKAPSARYPSAAEFVAELRAALRDDAGTTGWIVPSPPLQTAVTTVAAPPATTAAYAPRAAGRGPARRSRRLLLPLLLLLLIAGGIAAAVASTSGESPPAQAAKRKPVTIVRTVTEPGTTIEQTVTAPAQPPATVTTPSSPPATTAAANTSGAALNADGYAKMKAGDYQGALPLLQQAVRQLSGTSTLAEAYADYNLAYTQYELGSCASVLSLLDRSQAIQGRRTEIDALRHAARKTCG